MGESTRKCRVQNLSQCTSIIKDQINSSTRMSTSRMKHATYSNTEEMMCRFNSKATLDGFRVQTMFNPEDISVADSLP